MHGLGKGIRGFKDGLKEVSDEINSDNPNQIPVRAESRYWIMSEYRFRYG